MDGYQTKQHEHGKTESGSPTTQKELQQKFRTQTFRHHESITVCLELKVCEFAIPGWMQLNMRFYAIGIAWNCVEHVVTCMEMHENLMNSNMGCLAEQPEAFIIKDWS